MEIKFPFQDELIMIERKTLKDIAKDLKLSVSTVSKSLSDSYEISESTKKLVQDYAEKHHYVPNKVARTLKTGKTNTIGVIVFNISNTFISQVLDGIHNGSQAEKYDIIIMQSRDDIKLEKHAIDVLRMRGIDGLLISPVAFNSNIEQLEALQNSGIPVVLFDRVNHEIKTHKVGIDNKVSAYEATEHLINSGRSKILHITGKNIGVAADRLLGFKKCLLDHQIPFDTNLYLECDYSKHDEIENSIVKKLNFLKSQGKMPNAIFGATDDITTLTLGILAELNIKVPDEVCVIGFSNIRIPNSLNPSLSTVVQPTEEIGMVAFNKLVEIIKSKYPIDDFETIELNTKLIPRKSSMP
ncbi:LacI family DNA-binding transcriptional regulator [Sphingobacterium endophyticum]|uniref:LacI family DNA-binding transcriptional regulator n=1 Tax=Sphingobacterium endophyticum TaxID=2546448 RepID=UPI0012E1B895|nr:LacI family DNA-binding transcriptional regulator [Sphingobacterium endophyticum]